MTKNTKIENILIKNKVRGLTAMQHIKINDGAVSELGSEVKNNVNKIIETAKYIIELKGKKIIKKEDIKEAIQKMQKAKENYEI
jgi:histone H3/H4